MHAMHTDMALQEKLEL